MSIYYIFLCRYYVAEGVKLYSQETWRRVTDGRGVEMVEESLEKMVEFYVSQSQAIKGIILILQINSPYNNNSV